MELKDDCRPNESRKLQRIFEVDADIINTQRAMRSPHHGCNFASVIRSTIDQQRGILYMLVYRHVNGDSQYQVPWKILSPKLIIQIQLTNNNRHVTYKQIQLSHKVKKQYLKVAKQKSSTTIITGRIFTYHKDTLYHIADRNCYKLLLQNIDLNDENEWIPWTEAQKPWENICQKYTLQQILLHCNYSVRNEIYLIVILSSINPNQQLQIPQSNVKYHLWIFNLQTQWSRTASFSTPSIDDGDQLPLWKDCTILGEKKLICCLVWMIDGCITKHGFAIFDLELVMKSMSKRDGATIPRGVHIIRHNRTPQRNDLPKEHTRIRADVSAYFNIISNDSILMVLRGSDEKYIDTEVYEGYNNQLQISQYFAVITNTHHQSRTINQTEIWVESRNRGSKLKFDLNSKGIVCGMYVNLFGYFLLILQNQHTNKVSLYAFDDIDAIIDHAQNKGNIPNDSTRFKCNKKYQIGKKIGSGATSIVYTAVLNERQLKHGKFRETSKLKPYLPLIIKQQNQVYDKHDKMLQEAKILEKIGDNEYILDLSCRLIDYFMENGVYHLVLTKLGVTLQQLFNLNQNRFSFQQVCGIMNQMIGILYKLHSIGFVHNDIKPENILIGNIENNDINKLYLIDFGVAKPFWDFKNDKHVSEKLNVAFEGTCRFSSINHHCYAMNQSRRDDLESLIYMTIYFLNPQSLPWCKIDTSHIASEEEILTITKKSKLESSIEEICENIENGKPFEDGLNYVNGLKFDEMPDYLHLQSLFRFESQKQPTVRDLYNTTLSNKIRARMTKNVDYSSINNKMIDKYNDNIRLQSDRTKCNYRTHYSIHGLTNRNGYNIKSIIISTKGCGIPLEKPKKDEDYGGMIRYEPCGSMALQGRMYMLQGSLCKKINDQYCKKHQGKKQLNGQVHGAIYYHYFEEDVDQCDNSEEKKKFIRGFAVFGKENGVEYKFTSGAFNKTGLQLRDKKYRELAPSESLFIQYSLNTFWTSMHRDCNPSSDVAFYFKDFTKHKRSNLKPCVPNKDSLTDIEEFDATEIGSVAGYTKSKLESVVANAEKYKTINDQFESVVNGGKFKILKQVYHSNKCSIFDACINDENMKGIRFGLQHNLTRNNIITIKKSKYTNRQLNMSSNILLHEQDILKNINANINQDWTYKLLDSFIENDKYNLILSKMGIPLEHLFIEHNHKLPIYQVCNIVKQMIAILYKLHSYGYVHNNINLQNIVINTGAGIRTNIVNNNVNTGKLYLVDFVNASSFWDSTHNRMKQYSFESGNGTFGETYPDWFIGSTAFSSVNHHCYMKSQCPTDDLESLLYVAIYLANGTLPWILSETQADDFIYTVNKTQKIKMSSQTNEICGQLPKQFKIALKYIGFINQKQKLPDYEYLQSLFHYNKMQSNTQTNLWDFIGVRIRKQSNAYVNIQEMQVHAAQENSKNNGSFKPRVYYYTQDIMKRLGANCNDCNEYMQLVELPLESIVDIMSYLNDSDWKKLLVLGEYSNRLVKYVMYQQCFSVFIAQFECNNINRKSTIVDVRLTKVNKTDIDTYKINFGDLSLINDKNSLVIINKKLDNTGMKSIDHSTLESIKYSVFHCNRFNIVSRISNQRNKTKCINLSLKYLKDDEGTIENNLDEERIVWYWKTSNENIKSWKKYDKFTQIQIENAYNDENKSMVILDQGPIYSNIKNDKFYQKYAILFEDESDKTTSTFNDNSYHSISNKQWDKDVFTKYFYQKQVILNRYRIVKRVEVAKKVDFSQSMKHVNEQHFAEHHYTSLMLPN